MKIRYTLGMIISHKYKYIFLKTSKTAGTSIEIALSKFCGEDDIITQISPEDEQIRRELGYRGPQHYEYTYPLREYGPKDLFKRVVLGKVKKHRYYNHIDAAKVRLYIGRKIWNEYYKFCFERNPWDRLVSLYYYKHQSEPRPSISEFIESGGVDELKLRGYQVYTIGGRVVVDRVCRFEDMARELEEVRRHLGIPEPLELPNAKTGFRKKRDYRDILTEQDRETIRTLFRPEIELLGYTY